MNYYFVTGSSKGLGKALTNLLLKDENKTVFGDFSKIGIVTFLIIYYKHLK